MTKDSGGDELWDSFVKEFEKQNAPHEPSAVERALPPARRRRRWPWVALVGCLLLVAAGGAYRLGYLHLHPARQTSVAAHPVVPAVKAAPTASAAVPLAAVTPDQAFPATVAGYTRVGDAAAANCTGADSVGPTLAGMITQGHGCLGLDFALYKDSSENEYSLAVFTMKNPVDAATIVEALGLHPTDYEVAVQLPPPGSALRDLPASSGLVQAFVSYGHLVVVGMAQWSDGHSSDYQKLENQLSPLLDAVAKQAETHDRR
ncbi:hypothetical protein EDD99_1719 [Streptomyces sp. 846.5]|nr:hypothetical protein [Streptomyces sp. 846.5]TDU03298.1 hypothetical protein EDD99_1719 [Streptomyces sp. 846.5]